MIGHLKCLLLAKEILLEIDFPRFFINMTRMPNKVDINLFYVILVGRVKAAYADRLAFIFAGPPFTNFNVSMDK